MKSVLRIKMAGKKKDSGVKEFLSLKEKNDLKEEIKKELRDEFKGVFKENREDDFIEERIYNLDSENMIFPEKKEEVHEIKTESVSKKPVKVLVFLVIILLIVDIFSLYFYYKPDLSGFFKKITPTGNSVNIKNLKCNDGTNYDSCSKNKPLYCYNGELVKKAATCSCPSGYKVDFQDCREI